MSALVNSRHDQRLRSKHSSLTQRFVDFLDIGGRSRQLQAAIIVLALIPVAFAGYYGYQSADRRITATVLAKRDNISHLVATVMSEKLDRLLDVGLSLATRVQFDKFVARRRWTKAIKIMENIPSTYPYIERVFLANPQGVLVADTPTLPGVRGRDFSFRDWYRGVVRTGQPYISKIYKRTAVPRINVVAVAVPVKNESRALIGILVLQVKLESFFEWFKDAPASPDSLIYIVDRYGQTAFHPKFTPLGETVNLSAVPAVQKALRGMRGVEVGPGAGAGEQITAYAPVPRYGWGVVLEEPTATAFAARDAQLRRFAIVYVLMLLLSAFSAVLLLRAREQARRKADLEILVAERTRELETSNRELEAFSYSVSHDLRAPLRGIDGFSRILLDDCADKLSGQNKAYLERIRAATQRMGALIDDLLVLSRVTRAEMTWRNVDMSALAQSIVSDLRNAYPERRVTVHIESGLVAVGDPPLLRVVLENLIGNAWKFTGKTENARIEVGVADNLSQHPAYFVRDNGAGFDMTYADKLFGVFQRLHGMDEFPGSGVGLASVQRIVARYGGRIWAESTVGQGATFYFTLHAEESST